MEKRKKERSFDLHTYVVNIISKNLFREEGCLVS